MSFVPQPKTLTLEHFSDMMTTQVALERRGIVDKAQPIGRVIGMQAYRPETVQTFLAYPEDEDQAFNPGEIIVFEGRERAICVASLRKLARSREDTYHRANALRILEDGGMSKTAKVCNLISSMRSLVPHVVSGPHIESVSDGPITLNHSIDTLPPLTDREIDHYEDLIAIEEAEPVALPEQRDHRAIEVPTGMIAA